MFLVLKLNLKKLYNLLSITKLISLLIKLNNSQLSNQETSLRLKRSKLLIKLKTLNLLILRREAFYFL